jgi:hypothetical protein
MPLEKRLVLVAGIGIAALLLTARAGIDDRTYGQVAACEPDVGDIVFTRIGGPIFARVAETTGSWTSHLGIIVDYRDRDWIVAESGIPFVRETPLRTFLGRSVGAKFAICRLRTEPTAAQKGAMRAFAEARIGEPYSLGFDLTGRGTFCSKFVRDVVAAGTGRQLGETETFDHLLHANPRAPLGFWRLWFLGSIPWQRTTVTPASELSSPLLVPVVTHNL